MTSKIAGFLVNGLPMIVGSVLFGYAFGWEVGLGVWLVAFSAK